MTIATQCPECLKNSQPSTFVQICMIIMLSMAVIYGLVVLLFVDVGPRQDYAKFSSRFMAENLQTYEIKVGPLHFSSDGVLSTAQGEPFTPDTLVKANIISEVPSVKTLWEGYFAQSISDFVPAPKAGQGRFFVLQTDHAKLVDGFICARFMKNSSDSANYGCSYNPKKDHYAYWYRMP